MMQVDNILEMPGAYVLLIELETISVLSAMSNCLLAIIFISVVREARVEWPRELDGISKLIRSDIGMLTG